MARLESLTANQDAASTLPVAGGRHVDPNLGKNVPSPALAQAVKGLGTPYVLGRSDGLKMGWVHTRTHPTQVVYVQAVRNWADVDLIRDAVGIVGSAMNGELPVALRLGEAASPYPAVLGRLATLDALLETWLNWVEAGTA